MPPQSGQVPVGISSMAMRSSLLLPAARLNPRPRAARPVQLLSTRFIDRPFEHFIPEVSQRWLLQRRTEHVNVGASRFKLGESLGTDSRPVNANSFQVRHPGQTIDAGVRDTRAGNEECMDV